MEVLAIIAYKQPITRLEIESIRGVNCEQVLKSLSNIGLVKITGRKEVSGRPFLYGTSRKFLEYFGLNSLQELPVLEKEQPYQDGLKETTGGSITREPLEVSREEGVSNDGNQ